VPSSLALELYRRLVWVGIYGPTACAAATSATRAISLFDANAPRRHYNFASQHPFASTHNDQARHQQKDEPLPCRVAAEVPDFEPRDWLLDKDRDRVPRVVPLALAATQEALRGAGLHEISPHEKCEIDVVVGSGGGGFSFAEEQIARWMQNDKHLSPYAVSSSIAGMLSSEISIAHGFRGRSHTLSNGCTSSSDALGNALDLIRSGRSTTVISGGADGCITPAMMAGFCTMRAIPTRWNAQPERASRPFSADRDGFVLGEGAWIFVIEEREHAQARGANIWAEIAGYGATCEAFHRVALGEPDEAARAMSCALRDSSTRIEEIDYVNMHGTATQLNDPLESDAVKLALGAHAHRTPMSSTKSQIGHPQGASGAAGICAALFAMHENVIPATINLDTPDARCDLDYVPHQPRAARVETALCNCLGFGSKNAAIVLRKSI
jgi:3-oxoacyl-[acyl-carrier-protein] synthase II